MWARLREKIGMFSSNEEWLLLLEINAP